MSPGGLKWFLDCYLIIIAVINEHSESKYCNKNENDVILLLMHKRKFHKNGYVRESRLLDFD